MTETTESYDIVKPGDVVEMRLGLVFTSRASGRRLPMDVVEHYTVRKGKIHGANAFDGDTQAALAGKTVTDTCNYDLERDGPIPGLDDRSITSSELLLRYIPDAAVVMAYNTISTSTCCHWPGRLGPPTVVPAHRRDSPQRLR